MEGGDVFKDDMNVEDDGLGVILSLTPYNSIIPNSGDFKIFDNEVTNVACTFDGVKVKDEGINEVVNEGIIECVAATIKMLDKSDDLTIHFLGVDNSYSKRFSSLKLSFDDIGYKIFEYVN
ncbi:unnamed protein product [Dovyalis caffra]|uniref:Uncharacterized protein n=1 Tax=Dovyalis caffra TaxID=77055 RepID=A0AAV1QTM1_9ROSI|nr:unnamed protein product [Dovyalis caffra]